MTADTRGAQMHAIIRDDVPISTAVADVQRAESDGRAAIERASQAHDESKRLAHAAMLRGEPKPAIVPAMTKEDHDLLAQDVRRAEKSLRDVLGYAGPRLLPAIAAREGELLQEVLLTPVGELAPLVGELQELDSAVRLLRGSRLVLDRFIQTRSMPQSAVTMTATVEAALDGTSLLGEIPQLQQAVEGAEELADTAVSR